MKTAKRKTLLLSKQSIRLLSSNHLGSVAAGATLRPTADSAGDVLCNRNKSDGRDCALTELV